jgi:hypothetical protein
VNLIFRGSRAAAAENKNDRELARRVRDRRARCCRAAAAALSGNQYRLAAEMDPNVLVGQPVL